MSLKDFPLSTWITILATVMTAVSVIVSTREKARSETDKARKEAEYQTQLKDIYKDQADRFEKLNIQMIEAQNLTTGGDSILRVAPSLPGTNSVRFSIRNMGKYPIYDVQVTIGDIGKMQRTVEGVPPEQNDRVFDWNKWQTVYQAGNIATSQAKDLTIPFEGFSTVYTVTLLARNGFWNQRIGYKKVENEWVLDWEHGGSHCTNSWGNNPKYPKNALGKPDL